MDRIDIKSMDMDELTQYMSSHNEASYRAKQLFAWFHQRLVNDYDKMTDVSVKMKDILRQEATVTEFAIEDVKVSKDGSKKYLFRLDDGAFVETVFMEYHHGYSVCVSTQVGCAMNCAFCASGKGGLERNLTASEITEQVYAISGNEKKRIGNVVLMGMGEPLNNYDNVIRAIRLLTSSMGYNMSIRNITLSTCGIIPGIEKLMEENLGITLAISLHAPTQEKRREIMPVAKSHELKELIDACNRYRAKTGRRITYEYCLLGGFNDTDEDADALADLCSGSDAHINLIPYHRVEGSGFKAPTNPQGFKNRLEKKAVNVTIRRGLGEDIDGACGQLRHKRRTS